MKGLPIAIEQTVNASFGKIVARHRLTAVQVIRDMGFDKGDAHLQQRHVDELTALVFARASKAAMIPWAANIRRRNDRRKRHRRLWDRRGR